MRTILSALTISSLLVFGASAEFETWTNKEGNTAKMKLVEVVKDGDKAIGKFELENGKSVSLDADTLSEESTNRLLEWKPVLENQSVFDEMLDGNLVMLDGKEFADHALTQRPEKFYVFYYTASWCPPCRSYTPELIKFYERAKKKNNNFELILVTSDRSPDAMLKYAVDAKMPWPHVSFDAARDVRAKLNHGVTGIPSVIVCDLEGNVISRDRNLENLQSILTK